jgi:hypothetical protein
MLTGYEGRGARGKGKERGAIDPKNSKNKNKNKFNVFCHAGGKPVGSKTKIKRTPKQRFIDEEKKREYLIIDYRGARAEIIQIKRRRRRRRRRMVIVVY